MDERRKKEEIQKERKREEQKWKRKRSGRNKVLVARRKEEEMQKKEKEKRKKMTEGEKGGSIDTDENTKDSKTAAAMKQKNVCQRSMDTGTLSIIISTTKSKILLKRGFLQYPG